jgi:DNA polymerase-4
MQTKLPVIALVDMEAFLASVEQALNPELAGKPVIIGGLPGTRGIVICASYEARQLGVGFGMTLAEAYRTLPQAVFIKGDIKIYRELWGKICDIFAAYTPLVEPVSMDEAYLDLTDSIPSRGSIENLSQSLKNNIKQHLMSTVDWRGVIEAVRENRLRPGQTEKAGRARTNRDYQPRR